MRYEIDFLGLRKETKDADAICFRYYDEILQRYVVGVYDGGLTEYGVELKEHLLKYYFNNDPNPKIDYVICSHPDQDHAIGLAEILKNFKVGVLVMNRPWLYVDELFPKVYDGRITKTSLERRLRESYLYADVLEALAKGKGIPIREGFQGTDIDRHLTILSPSREFYLQLLVESSKTPLREDAHNLLAYMVNKIKSAFETWTNELIRENVETSAENESSIVVLGDMGEERFLLTGDAGIRALGAAADYAETNIYSLQTVNVQQIPHHGGRHNVSPSILNRVVGRIVPEGTPPTKTAIVSVAAGTDHPKKMVVNAYIRRGANVCEARTSTLQHHHGNMPSREGWDIAETLKFSKEVEDWQD